MHAVEPRADGPRTDELKEILSGLGFRPGRFKLMFEIDENGAVINLHDERAIPGYSIKGWKKVFKPKS